MSIIRRIYLYAVSFVSLETVLWGTIGLLRALFAGATGEDLAGSLSLIMVGAPVFLLHWRLVQREVRADEDERSSRLRALFLYGALLAAVLPAAQNLLALIDRAVRAVLDLPLDLALIGGDQTYADNLVGLAVNGLAATCLLAGLRREWAAGPEGDDFPETRRLYRHLGWLYGLALGVFGGQGFLAGLLSFPAAPAEALGVLADGLSMLATGLPIVWLANGAISASLTAPAERDSLLRRGLLYALTFLGIGGLFVAADLTLENLLAALLLETPQPVLLLEGLSDPLAAAAAFGALWVYAGRRLRVEVLSRPDLPRRDGMRRLYLYGLALFGLTGAFLGALRLLSLALDLLTGSADGGPEVGERLAVALAALAVGLPLWLYGWRLMRQEAAQEGEPGDRARRSLVRKAYLYTVIFAGVVGGMFSGGALIYEILNGLLAGSPGDLFAPALQQVGRTALFAGLLAYHGRALQTDARRAQRALTRRHAQFPVLVLAPDDAPGNGSPEARGFASVLVDALHRQAPDLPVAVHPYSGGVPDESLAAARAVILPADLVAHPSEAYRLWLGSYTGLRVVVPGPSAGWFWVGASGRGLAGLAGQAALTVRRLAEGEVISPPRDASPWLIPVYVLAGLFALEVVLALGASLFIR